MLENNEGAIKQMDNPDKLATLGTQDEKKNQTNKKHNTICFIISRIMQRKSLSFQCQLGIKEQMVLAKKVSFLILAIIHFNKISLKIPNG